MFCCLGVRMVLTKPDWRSYFRPRNADGSDKDAATEMIGWLSGRSPVVWHAFVSRYMNRDTALPVGFWIARQPDCDCATAAALLFGSDPAGCVCNPDVRPADCDLIELILANWEEGYYRQSRIAEDLGAWRESLTALRDALQEAQGAAPFRIPDAFLGPFRGVEATFPQGEDPATNPYVWALLSALGTEVPNALDARWEADARAAQARWEDQCRNNDFLTRLFWSPEELIPRGPDFHSVDERDLYLAGDPDMAELLFERATQAARKRG